MNISYEEFMQLIPDETKEYINNVIDILYSMQKSNHDVEISLNSYSALLHTNNRRVAFSLLLAFEKNNHQIFYIDDINKYYYNFILINCPDDKRSAIFNYYLASLVYHKNKIDYDLLGPLDIAYEFKEKVGFGCILFNASNLNNFLNEYINTNNLKIEEIARNEFLDKDCSISAFEYLKDASQLRNKIIIKNNSKLSDGDIVPLSLLVALFCRNASTKEETEAIYNYLNQNKVLEELLSILKISNIALDSESRYDGYALIELYKPYFDEACKEKKPQDVTISDIFKIALDNNFTNSYILDKVLSKEVKARFMNLPCFVEQEKQRLKEESRKKFYNNLDKRVRDFIESFVKIYQYLNTIEGYNKDLIHSSDDIDTLSILLANYLFKGDFSSCLVNIGIELKDILDLLNINLDMGKINAMDIDFEQAGKVFNRYIRNGNNSNSSKITIDSISKNLFDEHFNKSTIIADIWYSFNKDKDFPSNLSLYVDNYLKYKARKSNEKIKLKVLYDLPVETIEYLENASIIYNMLKDTNFEGDFKEEQIIASSLLLAVFYSNNEYLKKELSNRGLTRYGLYNYFNLGDHYYLSKDNMTINIIRDKFGLFIFGGLNKDLDRKDITIDKIARNIINPLTTNYLKLANFFSHFNITYDDFSNLEENYKKEVLKAKEDDYQRLGSNRIANMFEKYFIIDLVKYYQVLNVENKEERIDLAFILTIFNLTSEYKHTYFLEKHGITLEKILKMYKLDINSINIDNIKFDYHIYENVFQKLFEEQYFKNNNKITIADTIEKWSNDSKILKKFIDVSNSDYEHLLTELRECKDYEDLLSILQRTEMLKQEKVEELDCSSTESLISYGGVLSKCSEYINDKYDEVGCSYESNNPLESILEVIKKTKDTKKEVTKGFVFKRKSYEIVPGKNLTKEDIDNLREKIANAIDQLSKEAITYGNLIEYIKVFISKQEEYLLQIDKAKAQEEQKKINKNNEYDKFINQLLLNNIDAKRNTFVTSIALWRQEILKYMQLISNHFININTLVMTRDSLIPLLSSEMMISSGIATEKGTFELQSDVVGILESLINKNSDDIKDNMDKLTSLSIPQDLLNVLTININSQIEAIKENQLLNESSQILKLEKN